MMFKIGLQAPHGGLFVIPIVNGNPLIYLGRIILGSIVAALIMGITKKTVNE